MFWKKFEVWSGLELGLVQTRVFSFNFVVLKFGDFIPIL
jgi:hypothetical protein